MFYRALKQNWQRNRGVCRQSSLGINFPATIRPHPSKPLHYLCETLISYQEVWLLTIRKFWKLNMYDLQQQAAVESFITYFLIVFTPVWGGLAVPCHSSDHYSGCQLLVVLCSDDVTPIVPQGNMLSLCVQRTGVCGRQWHYAKISHISKGRIQVVHRSSKGVQMAKKRGSTTEDLQMLESLAFNWGKHWFISLIYCHMEK